MNLDVPLVHSMQIGLIALVIIVFIPYWHTPTYTIIFSFFELFAGFKCETQTSEPLFYMTF